MALDLRPLTLAELLDRSFSLYKRHLWLFVGIMALPSAFAMVFAVLLRLFNAGATNGALEAMPPDKMLRTMVPLFIGAFVFFILYTAIHTFAFGATAIAVSRLILDREATAGAAYRALRPHAGRLVLVLIWMALRLFGTWIGLVVVSILVSGLFSLVSPILGGLVVFVALFASFLLVAFMAIRYGVAVPAVVLDGIPAGAALRRSVQLTKGNLGRVFLMMLCAIMIAYATAAIFQGPFALGSVLAGPGTTMSLVLGLIGAVLGALGGMFSGPLMMICLAMMYYDLRIRKEALDLHLQLENLDAPQPQGERL